MRMMAIQLCLCAIVLIIRNRLKSRNIHKFREKSCLALFAEKAEKNREKCFFFNFLILPYRFAWQKSGQPLDISIQNYYRHPSL